jgi:hypothetical protein
MQTTQSRRVVDERFALRVLCLLAALLAACEEGTRPALTRIMEAHRLTAALRDELTSASHAADRAVMAQTDESSKAFADQAQRSTAQAAADLDALDALIRGLDLREEAKLLASFRVAFDNYRTLDRKILALAVENTNLHAQRLAFGPARETADRIETTLEPLTNRASSAEVARSEHVMALRAALAVRRIEALHAPHIAASEDAVMTQLERQMAASYADARAALETLAQSKDAETRATAAGALAELANFGAVHEEIITLSRRNSGVRSLALSLGEKLALANSCERMLDELSRDLDMRTSPARR